MIRIGKFYNREVRCLITNMDNPLGTSIGNSLEVLEAINVLKNKENNYLTDLCLELSANMVSMARNISMEEAMTLVKGTLESGLAYEKFLQFVKHQGGDIEKLSVSDKTSRNKI